MMTELKEHFLFRQSGCCNYLKNSEFMNQAGLGALSPASGSPISAVKNGGFDPALLQDKCSVQNPDKKWFVMRDLKRPNAKMPAYRLLEDARVEVFTPMKRALVRERGRNVCQEVPVIQDLLFVHSTSRELDPILGKNPTLQYRYVRGQKYRTPMTVSDAEMDRFTMAVHTSESFRYYRPDELTSAMYGRKVRIIGGPLDNYEGCLLKGLRKKILLVELQGFLSVGVEVSPDYIQFI